MVWACNVFKIDFNSSLTGNGKPSITMMLAAFVCSFKYALQCPVSERLTFMDLASRLPWPQASWLKSGQLAELGGDWMSKKRVWLRYLSPSTFLGRSQPYICLHSKGLSPGQEVLSAQLSMPGFWSHPPPAHSGLEMITILPHLLWVLHFHIFP